MRWIVGAIVLVSVSADAVVEPPLPFWDSEERGRMIDEGWIAGGYLLNFEAPPGEEKVEEKILEGGDVGPEQLAEDEADQNFVSEEYLLEYFADRPSSFLIDPQELLGTRERKDLEAFLEDHSGESSIDMFVYAFGGDQEIPSDVREEEVVERLYSVGKPAVIIYYYVGAPQRTTIYLSPVITDVVSAAEQRRALESSVIRAFGSADPFDQLEAFLVQMSIRIYWMERMAEGTAEETKGAISEEESAAADSVAANVSGEDSDALESGLVPSWLKVSGGSAVSVFGLFVFFWSGFRFLKERARYVFPDFEVEPRLGASHAAGIGAVISFSSSEVSPARQRDQVPDYMRRA